MLGKFPSEVDTYINLVSTFKPSTQTFQGPAAEMQDMAPFDPYNETDRPHKSPKFPGPPVPGSKPKYAI